MDYHILLVGDVDRCASLLLSGIYYHQIVVYTIVKICFIIKKSWS